MGRGAADINNNYWFEPLSIRDLSNLKITSEINYVRLISPGPRSVYRRGYFTDGGSARVCVLPLNPLLSTLPSPPVSRGQVELLPSSFTLLSSLVFVLSNIMSSAPAHARIGVIMWNAISFIKTAPPFPSL